LDQALMAFAGEASAQVVLVAGEGIGDGGAVVLLRPPQPWPRRLGARC
jgi:hypothetical protein